MSKESTNLRLLGSPVNLTYRNKKKDDKKHSRNRPRSALQNSCFTPENQESFKRPFSADAKERIPSTRSFLNSFNAELLQSYKNSPISVKVLAPTKDILDNPQYSHRHEKDLKENVSDYGSEDTFISLGTRIKAKAQVGPKIKPANTKNNFKYKNVARRGRKPIINTDDNKNKPYGLEINITEHLSESPIQTEENNCVQQENSINFCKSRPYESYFFSLEHGELRSVNSLDRKSRLAAPNIKTEVEKAIDTYSQRLNITKQQLSLVEEESTQDIESAPSQIYSSLSPENTLNDNKYKKIINETESKSNNYIDDLHHDNFSKTSTFLCEPRTYNSFNDHFESSTFKKHNKEMSRTSTLVHTDASSKDSGYIDGGLNDDKLLQQNYSLRFPSTGLRKSSSHTTIDDQPKSFDSSSTGSNNDKYCHKTFPFDKKSTEPLNHSRLLYKDFFIKKEGHIALPPQNSPTNNSLVENTYGDGDSHKTKKALDYPPYLINSPTKVYTSKVIEDYKKELEAINNLHELTLEDLKMDAISPTPLNIDKMFEQNSSPNPKEDGANNKALQENYFDSVPDSASVSIDNKKRDVSKISTKELIQNYFKVKEADYNTSKNLKKVDRKYSDNFGNANNLTSNNLPTKQNFNNKNTKSDISKSSVSANHNNKNLYATKPPLSARIEGVQNDKDIDSWMSLSAPTPRTINVDSPNEDTNSSKVKQSMACEVESIPPLALSSPVVKDLKETPKDLNSQSTVFNIYSMLKEIESYGDNPVTSVVGVTGTDANSTESKKREDEENNGPKDNFTEIFEFLEKVEQSANDALSVVTSTIPQTVPKLECLLKLPQTELAQRLVTASLQLEERSCCIALLQESLTNHKEQMISKVSNLEKQSLRNIAKVKQECEETIKRHQNFIDQLINDKKTLNHRIEQLVDERRALEERWKRSAQALEERYKLELRNQHDKMVAAQQELTVKGLEGELREMAERQQKEVSDLKMYHAEQCGRMQGEHANDLERLRRTLEEEKENALAKERQLASSRLEKQIMELELTYQEQRTRLVGDMRAENERANAALSAAGDRQRRELEKWKEEQEKLLNEKRLQMEEEIAKEREKQSELLKQKEQALEERFEEFKKEFQAEQQVALKKRVEEISTQHKQERDREIEKAIESMEAEAQAGRKELQEALRRNKEQYEGELRELAETEAATVRRCREAQARLREAEDRCAELEVNVNQLETRNKVLVDKNNQLECQAEEIRASCEQAWKKKVEEIHQEMETMRRKHEEQMHQLYAKVKVAVARKDSAIQALTRESAKHQEKITLLEQKLQQQRKDFLKHK